MRPNESSLFELRKRRAEAQEARDRERLRAQFGERLTAAVAEAVQRPLSLKDFDVRQVEPFRLCWPVDIRDAPGLVAAYVSRSEAHGLLVCFRTRLSMLNGKIGFHEKPYLGFASLDGVDPTSLLLAAEITEDSVVFFNDQPSGAVLVDYYASNASEPFSVMVQGDRLVELLTECFSAQSDDRSAE